MRALLRFALLALFFGSTATADVTVPSATRPHYSNVDYAGASIYRVRDIYLRDGDTNTMRLRAPSLSSDNVSFVLPSADGGANQVLKTDGSGNLGWTTPLVSPLGADLEFEGGSDGEIGVTITAADDTSVLELARANDALASPDVVVTGDQLGVIRGRGYDGDSYSSFGAITFVVDGVAGTSNDYPGRIGLFTVPDGSGTLTERLRIDSAGKLKVGDIANAPTTDRLNIAGPTDSEEAISLASSDNSSGLNLMRASGTIASPTVVVSGDQIGAIRARGYDGDSYSSFAVITFSADGTPGSTNDYPGRMSFFTVPDGSGTLTERMRIDNAGAVSFPSVGTTASAANAFLNSGSSPANSLLRSTSSRKYKSDERPVAGLDAERVIKGLRPITYKSKAKADDPTKRWLGFVAEDVAEVEPMLVHYVDGEPDGVQYERIVVLLVAEVQRLSAEVAALKEKK